jgi:hypothetical protein
MMETVEHFPSHESEETLVTPRFDREEARSAQPVVPLAAVSRAEHVEDRVDARAPHRDFRHGSWWLAIVFGSALVGSLLGGAALYFYQEQRDSEVAISPSIEKAVEPAPSPESSPTPEVPAAISAPATSANEPAEGEASSPSVSSDLPKQSEAAPRAILDDEIKQGTKGERETEVLVRDERPRRVADRDVDPTANEYEPQSDNHEARRVGEITYPRSRRWERRARRQQPVDRVRGIFEGQP